MLNLTCSPLPVRCETCHQVTYTTNLCWHCGRIVCQLCWTRYHQCLPTHSLLECPSLDLFIQFGEAYINLLRRQAHLPPLG